MTPLLTSRGLALSRARGRGGGNGAPTTSRGAGITSATITILSARRALGPNQSGELGVVSGRVHARALAPLHATAPGRGGSGGGGRGGGGRGGGDTAGAASQATSRRPPRPPTREELEMDVEDMFLDDLEAAELRRQLRRQSGTSLEERAEGLRKRSEQEAADGTGAPPPSRGGRGRDAAAALGRRRDPFESERRGDGYGAEGGGDGDGRGGEDAQSRRAAAAAAAPRPKAPPAPPAAAAFFAPKSWADVGASAEVAEALRALGFPRPSHVQAASFPALLARVGGDDSEAAAADAASSSPSSSLPPPLFPHVAVADQAGSGKTLAYLAPLLQELREEELLLAGGGGSSSSSPASAWADQDGNGNANGGGRSGGGRGGVPATKARAPRLIVLAPTAELAQQVASVARQLSEAGLRHRRAIVTGGEADPRERQKRFRTQKELLAAGVDLVVATPGRLLEHWRRGSLDLSGVRAVVLDEVDVLCAGGGEGPGAEAGGGAMGGALGGGGGGGGSGHREAVGPLVEAARREVRAKAVAQQQQQQQQHAAPASSSPKQQKQAGGGAGEADLAGALADAFRPPRPSSAAAAERDDNDDDQLQQQQQQYQGPEGPRFVLVSATIPAGALGALRELFPGLVGAFGPGLHRTSPGLREELIDCSGGAGEPSLESGNARKLSALRRALRRVGAQRAVVFCNKLETCRLVENAMRRWRDADGAAFAGGLEEQHEEDAFDDEEEEEEEEEDWEGHHQPPHEPLPYHEAVRDELRKANLARFLQAPPPPPPPPSADAAALQVAAATAAAANASGRRSLFPPAAPRPAGPLALVCTDRASRGIDTSACEHVVLFDFPRDPSEYVRRVGRTARGARGQGVATILALGRQVPLAREVLARTTARAPVHRVPDVLQASGEAAPGDDRAGGGGGGGGEFAPQRRGGGGGRGRGGGGRFGGGRGGRGGERYGGGGGGGRSERYDRGGEGGRAERFGGGGGREGGGRRGGGERW